MTTRKARGYGSFDDIPRKDALSFPLQPHIDAETIGFRLAHNSDSRPQYGGSFRDDQRRVRTARKFVWEPQRTDEILSFRLAYDIDDSNDKENGHG